MRALLLAAGLGSRLRPLTDVIPKCLVPVNGRPLLEYWLEALASLGTDEILINLHHHSDLVEHYLQNSPHAQRIKTVREERLLGTGGTLAANRKFWEDGDVFLAHADNLMACDLHAFIDAHRSRTGHQVLTLMTFDTDDPRNCGIVETDPQGNVVDFCEKPAHPRSNRASAAVFILSPGLVDYLPCVPDGCELDFSRQVVSRLSGHMRAWHNEVYHRDIGTVASYLQAQIEYPAMLPEPTGTPAWQNLLEQHGDALLNSMTDSLLRACNVKPSPGLKVLEGITVFEGAGKSIVVAERFDDHLLGRLESIAPAQDALFILKRVPPHFSARAMHTVTGQSSIALLAEGA